MSLSANGNILYDGANDYLYSDANRLVQVQSQGLVKASYVYNGIQQRVKKTDAAGQVTYFLYDTSGYLLAELDQTGVFKKEYIRAGNELIAVIDSQTVVSTPATTLSVSRDLRSPQQVGTVYTVTAAAGGGSGTYEYRFEWRNKEAGGGYQILQDYSPNAVLSFDTTGRPGTNYLRISARNLNSTDVPVVRWANVSAN